MLALAPDGSAIAWQEDAAIWISADGRLFRAEDGALRFEVEIGFLADDLQVSADGRQILVNRHREALAVFDESGRRLWIDQGPAKHYHIRLTQGGVLAVEAQGRQRVIALRDAQDGCRLKTLEFPSSFGEMDLSPSAMWTLPGRKMAWRRTGLLAGNIDGARVQVDGDAFGRNGRSGRSGAEVAGGKVEDAVAKRLEISLGGEG